MLLQNQIETTSDALISLLTKLNSSEAIEVDDATIQSALQYVYSTSKNCIAVDWVYDLNISYNARQFHLMIPTQYRSFWRGISRVLIQLQARKKAAGNQCETFHGFPKLPLELRQDIWGLALSTPRIIALEFFKRDHTRKVTTKSRLCALLGVNKEAREEALKVQRLLVITSPVPTPGVPIIHTNPTIDYICLLNVHIGGFSDITRWINFYQDYFQETTFNINRLVISYDMFKIVTHPIPIMPVVQFRVIVQRIPFKELIVIVQGEALCYEEDAVFTTPKTAPFLRDVHYSGPEPFFTTDTTDQTWEELASPSLQYFQNIKDERKRLIEFRNKDRARARASMSSYISISRTPFCANLN